MTWDENAFPGMKRITGIGYSMSGTVKEDGTACNGGDGVIPDGVLLGKKNGSSLVTKRLGDNLAMGEHEKEGNIKNKISSRHFLGN